jgi:hypothetical protein
VKGKDHWIPAGVLHKPRVCPAFTWATEEKRLCSVEQAAEMRETLFMVLLGLLSKIQDSRLKVRDTSGLCPTLYSGNRTRELTWGGKNCKISQKSTHSLGVGGEK